MTLFTAAFHVFGIPKAQPRARAFARKLGNGKFAARIYDAGTAEGWKALVAAAATPYAPKVPMLGAVSVMLAFLMPRPKSLCRKKDPDGVLWSTSKPDCDNLAKAVLDCLTQQGWWRDDAQVVQLQVAKHYPAKDGKTGLTIHVTEYGEVEDYMALTAAAREQP